MSSTRLGICSFVVCSALCLAAEPPRPTCNSKNTGRLWPDAANHDHATFSKLARCGQLAMCVRGEWRYHWEPVTVRLDQLRGGSKLPKPDGCEVTVQPSSPSDKITASAGTQ